MTILTLRWPAAARLAAAALAAALLVSCGQDSPQKLMASAKAYLARGDRNAAVIQLKNLLSKTPDNGEARLLLGEALLETEDYVSAEKELGRALELKQPHEKVLPLYVRALLAQGKNQAVVTEVEKYKLFNPPAVAATQTALGDAQTQLGNRARAREAYAAAAAAVPGYAGARLGEARLIAIEGRLDEALRQIEEVIVAEPKLAEARSFKADILLAKGDRVGGRKALEEAIGANDRYLPARLKLIGLMTDERDFDGAAKLIDTTRKVAPGDLRVLYLNAALAFRKGDLERARQQVQQVLKHSPENLPSLLLAGAIDMQAEQFVSAEAILRKALAQAPNHLDARQLLVRTYLFMGQPAKARDVLQPLVDRGLPAIPQLQMLAGETYLANGDVKRATAFFQEAAKGQNGQQVAARMRLGQVALAAGRSEAGFTELQAASELEPAAYQADLALISAHLRRNEVDKAMGAVKTLEKKQPKNPLTFQMYGEVNLAKRDPNAARKSFEKALQLEPTYLPAAYKLAELDIVQKKPDDARKRYEAMIAKEKNNEQLYIALADLQQRTGAESRDIAATLQRGIQANPQAPAPRLALISLHLRSGETKAALTTAQEAIAAIPSDPRLLDIAGLAQEAAGEVNQAIGTFSKLASLQPQAVQPLYRLASLYIRQKDADKAIESLRRAQKIAPAERDVVSQLVRVYLDVGRYDEALKEARELQRREPTFATGRSLEGDVYLSQRKFGEAERLYREALKLAPTSSAVAIKLHGALSAAGKSGEADAWVRKWLVENPKDTVIRLYVGERELVAKNLKSSAAYYQAVIAIEPNNALALNNLAYIGGELGDPKAVGYAERAVTLAPNNADILDTYGMLLMNKGEVEKALPILDRARKIAPARNDVRLHYAKALLKAGKKDEARRELEALQAVKDNFPGRDEVAALIRGL